MTGRIKNIYRLKYTAVCFISDANSYMQCYDIITVRFSLTVFTLQAQL
ncbi:MAG: hypothetical protein RL172_1053 [Bacteroidota bacterium]|jgi:hypothetical protein